MIISGCKSVSLLKNCFENSEHSLIRFVTYNDLHNVNDMKQDTLEGRMEKPESGIQNPEPEPEPETETEPEPEPEPKK